MNELLQLDETIFQEDESLRDRMERTRPKVVMTNAALSARCGDPPIPIYCESDEVCPSETEMFNILVNLINVPNSVYVCCDYITADHTKLICSPEPRRVRSASCACHKCTLPLHDPECIAATHRELLVWRSLDSMVFTLRVYQTNPC